MGTAFVKPLVSVIVPVYNVEMYIENCLNSLLAQTYGNWEAILVDDGSPDRSGEICERYAEKDSRFKVLRKPNGGQSSARNLAFDYCKGDYIFFLDSDDFLHKDTFSVLVSLAIKHKADIVQCGYIRGSETSYPAQQESSIEREYDNRSIFTMFAADVSPWDKLYSRDVIGDIKYPEGLVNEDDFTIWKFYYRASKIIVTTRKLYYYTVNPQSTMAQQRKKPNLKYFDAYRERIHFFSEHNEPELVAASMVQWMKSLVMVYAHPALTAEEKKSESKAYNENYAGLYAAAFAVPRSLNLVFKSFKLAPWLVSRAVTFLYRSLR